VFLHWREREEQKKTSSREEKRRLTAKEGEEGDVRLHARKYYTPGETRPLCPYLQKVILQISKKKKSGRREREREREREKERKKEG